MSDQPPMAKKDAERYRKIAQAFVQVGALGVLAFVLYGVHLYLEAYQTHIHDLVHLMLSRCLPQPGVLQ